MSLMNKIPQMLEYVNDHSSLMKFNSDIFTVYEGQLLKFIAQDLRTQFSRQSFEQVMHRVSPINVLIKVIDKLSSIYQKSPIREVMDGSQSDKELLAWYEKNFQVNYKLNIANEFYNLFKNTLIQPYVHNGVPSLRAIPSNQYLVFSDDKIDPTNPTHVITYAGIHKMENGRESKVFHAYSDEEFLIFTDDERILFNQMAEYNNEDGVNPYGKIPFIYVNKSNNLLIPLPDEDSFQIIKLIPILMSDLNYAVMFQAFSIIYGMNLDEQQLVKAPNGMWFLQPDPSNPEVKPEIGVIKPQVDINEVLELIQSELAFWLNTKGVKPGSIGTLKGDNFASGVSKMIDEMDTSEERERQANVFGRAEEQLWDLVFNHMHPVWSQQGLIDNRTIWTPSAYVKTTFAEQVPLFKRGELVDNLQKEVAAGFTTKRRAIKKLNPHFTEEELDNLMLEIEDERTISLPQISMEEEDDDQEGRELLRSEE